MANCHNCRLHYTRLMFIEYLCRRMQELLGYRLGLKGLALMEKRAEGD